MRATARSGGLRQGQTCSAKGYQHISHQLRLTVSAAKVVPDEEGGPILPSKGSGPSPVIKFRQLGRLRHRRQTLLAPCFYLGTGPSMLVYNDIFSDSQIP